ncbi:DUF4234 domain-containing protein [Enterococcus gallinarum]|uniref:DUF4234 domain-containing protein n=1 Tax=Enterococcus gallinarum TaxID=1353 RepID=UPI0020CDB7F1|nr:DUF4234 domain-containing protein [Enterococcus gallinarum]
MYQNYQSKKKSILMVILLTIITCGIYSLFWLYQTTQDLTEYSEDYRLTPGMSVLLTIITCGLYQIYWWYRIADIFITAQEKTKFPRINDNKDVSV